MGKPTGFMEIARDKVKWKHPSERITNYLEFQVEHSDEKRQEQGARCMDCGVPFCQSNYGCPVHNLIPEWNDLIYHGKWEEAYHRLRKTNNFPEYTGRVCPAPCETACVLGINEPAVTIKDNEAAIIDRAYASGIAGPKIPKNRTGKNIAIVGSGPAGLAAADELNQAGHSVTVFEREDRIGGLLMYGIPNMKLDKGLVEKKNGIMAEEGITFRPGVAVGKDISAEELLGNFDSVLLATGATVPRDLPIPGRDLEGVHFAMHFLTENTRALLSGKKGPAYLDVKGKKVIVIGGGDTGNDCIGTSIRQGASSVINFELLDQPSAERTDEFPWPTYPRVMKNDYGHQEASHVFGRDPREWKILSKEFVGKDGRLVGVKTVRVEWLKQPGERPTLKEVEGSEEFWEADAVFLAMGFLGPEQALLGDCGIGSDARSNIQAEYGKFATSHPQIFAAGDCRRGQSLVVWAINEGRGAARQIDLALMGTTSLRG